MTVYKPKILERTEFGNPILRKKARHLTIDEITGNEIQELIADMRYTCSERQYGVGLAAAQVGVSVALSVIAIKPTPSRPDSNHFTQTIINPEVIGGIGEKEAMWEGCMSFSSLDAPVFAQVQRYRKIIARYFDGDGVEHEEEMDGLVAHVFQHETDHCNGILFVDKVEDPTTWMNASEYQKMINIKNK